MLAQAGIEQPRREARLLLGHVLGLGQTALLADLDRAIDRAPLEAAVRRRAAREPLALITGAREFWSLPFAVSPATIVPRPDSETLIEAALARLPQREGVRRVLDLGTGTGCLLLAALGEFPAAFGVGVDRAAAAVGLARQNAAALGLGVRAAFLVGDWAAAIQGCFELVLCNPPYIASAEFASLMPEVARYEPALALDGGPDGLAAYRAVIATLPSLIAERGVAVLELGLGQAAPVARLAQAAGLRAQSRADLAGIERALILDRPPR